MLARLVCCVALLALGLLVPAAAQADCQQTISRVMSKDTEKLTTRYQRVARRMDKEGRTPKLIAEGCRIARLLEPKLSEQIAALKQSGCGKDPAVGGMVADIVRGHEDDLAEMRKQAQAECR